MPNYRPMWFCVYSPTSSMQQIHPSTTSPAHVSVRFFFFTIANQIVTQYTMTLRFRMNRKPHTGLYIAAGLTIFSKRPLAKGIFFRSSLGSFVKPCFEWVPLFNIFFLFVFLLVNAYFIGEVVEGENKKFDEGDMLFTIPPLMPGL